VNTADSYRGHNLVFIVGSPRSGTTWLQRLLAANPKIQTGQESKVFRAYLSPQLRAWRWELNREKNPETATGRGGTGLSCYFREDEFLRILRGYMLQLLDPMIRNLQPGELFVEKTPQHALCIAEIKEMLPECKIIHLLRDARDVVASLLHASRGWGAGWAPSQSGKAAATWVRHVKSVRESAASLSEREFLEITYERLWGSTDSALREVSNFLGLDWSDDEMAEAIEANRSDAVRAGNGTSIPNRGEVAERSGAVVRDPRTFVRKAEPGGWRSDLSLGEKIRVWRVARKTMRQVGYHWR
jgi:hypothetical protein